MNTLNLHGEQIKNLPDGYDATPVIIARDDSGKYISFSEHQFVTTPSGEKIKVFTGCGGFYESELIEKIIEINNNSIEAQNTTLTESLNFALSSANNIPARAVTIDPASDINFYDTLCLYCATNDINTDKISDNDYDSAVETIECYADSVEPGFTFEFWID